MSPQQDLNSLVKVLQPESAPKVPKKSYAAPTNEIDEVSIAMALLFRFDTFCKSYGFNDVHQWLTLSVLTFCIVKDKKNCTSGRPTPKWKKSSENKA